MKFEPFPEGVRVTVPPRGMRRDSLGFLVVGLVVLLMMVPFWVKLASSLLGGPPIPIPACIALMQMVPFTALGVGLSLLSFALARRSAVFEATRDRLIIQSWGVFGTKRHEWSAQDVRSIEVVRYWIGGSDDDDSSEPLSSIWIRIRGAPPLQVLGGRPTCELHTVAQALRNAQLPRAEAARMGPGKSCQVCGGPMTSAVVHCRRCRTPHHEECWSYTGRCSTYGCGEESFTRDTAADP